MKHLFVPYELAVAAKEKGFNELCIATQVIHSDPFIGVMPVKNSDLNGFLETQVCSPLYQQLVDWFYYPHNIVIGYDYKTDLWTASKNRELLHENGTLDGAIEEAFKLI